MSTFEYTGLWWLPDQPSEKVAGTLRFSDEDGAELSLTGTLGQPAAGIEEKRVSVILGSVFDCPSENEVTLRKCWVRSYRLGSAGIARETYFADRIFMGAHLEKTEDPSFSEVRIRISGLPSWAASLTGLSQKALPRPESGGFGGFEIRWQGPQPVAGKLPGGSMTVGVGVRLSMSQRSWTITEEVSFNIKCEEPQPESDLMSRYVYPLQNLMTLATDHPNAVVEFAVKGLDKARRILVFGSRVFQDEQAATELLPYKMLFTLEDVKERAVDLVAKWIDIYKRLETVCNPYFAIQYKPDSFVDTKFLTVFQTLMAYQRLREPHRSAIVPSDADQAESLEVLLREHELIVVPLFGRDIAAAVQELMKYRNFIVYRDTDLAKRPDYSEDLYWLTQKLMVLMKACLLSQLGIQDELQVKFFRRNQLYVHLVSRSKG